MTTAKPTHGGSLGPKKPNPPAKPKPTGAKGTGAHPPSGSVAGALGHTPASGHPTTIPGTTFGAHPPVKQGGNPPHRPPTPVTAVHPPAPKPPANGGFKTSAQQTAFELLQDTLKSWGLLSLVPDLRKLILAGDTAGDTLTLKLSQTDAYKQRFAGNELRKANGLPELLPAQYIAMEDGYQQVLQAYGLPKGFYDSHADFTDFIGKDLSTDELKTRAQVAHDQYMNAPQYMKDLWGKYYGSSGDIIAGILDPGKATQVIKDRGDTVALGGAAAANGFNVGVNRANQFRQAGVTLQGAQSAYQQLAQSLPTDQTIAKRFGTSFDQTQEENDLLLHQGEAATKRQTLYDEEKGLFKSDGGALNADALGVSQEH
jgi:hypothetical protein